VPANPEMITTPIRIERTFFIASPISCEPR
jgi:hypothetical protein